MPDVPTNGDGITTDDSKETSTGILTGTSSDNKMEDHFEVRWSFTL